MRSVIAHGHIFKNAGTTFDWALKKNFGNAFCDHRDDHLMRKDGALYVETLLRDNTSLRAISSHHMDVVSSFGEINIIPVYWLRNPIERALSVYNFERKQVSGTPGAEAAKKLNIKEYVEWRLDPKVGGTIRNYQAAYLAGAHIHRPSQQITNDIFIRAVRRLSSVYCIGVVERYDESSVLFEQHMAQYFKGLDLSYIPQNVANKQALDISKLDYLQEELGDVYEDLVAANSFDLALYALANSKLDSAIDNIVGFDSLLSEYNSRCLSLLSGGRIRV